MWFDRFDTHNFEPQLIFAKIVENGHTDRVYYVAIEREYNAAAQQLAGVRCSGSQ